MNPKNAPLGSAPVTDNSNDDPVNSDDVSAEQYFRGRMSEKGREWGRLSIKILRIAGATVVLSVAAFFGQAFLPLPSLRTVVLVAGLLGYAAALLLAFVGLFIGLRALSLLRRSADPADSPLTLKVTWAVIGNAVLSIGGAILTLKMLSGLAHGRQLRRSGRALLPPVGAGGAWSSVALKAGVDASARASVASQWRSNGRAEHASVAAFSWLTLDLMAVGAPPALVAAASRDAQDEVRHTELCFSVARALDGKSESPAAFPAASRSRELPATRPAALATLAVDSLVDGAFHEGAAARVLAQLARRCEEPSIADVLQELAADEGRHAAHGWDVIAWCLAEGGSPVAAALRGAVRALPRAARSEVPAGAEGGAWERYGVAGRALEAAQLEATVADLERRVDRLLGEAPAKAA